MIVLIFVMLVGNIVLAIENGRSRKLLILGHKKLEVKTQWFEHLRADEVRAALDCPVCQAMDGIEVYK